MNLSSFWYSLCFFSTTFLFLFCCDTAAADVTAADVNDDADDGDDGVIVGLWQ